MQLRSYRDSGFVLPLHRLGHSAIVPNWIRTDYPVRSFLAELLRVAKGAGTTVFTSHTCEFEVFGVEFLVKGVTLRTTSV